MSSVGLYALVNSRLLTLFLLFNLAFVSIFLLTSEFQQSLGVILQEQWSEYRDLEDADILTAPAFTEQPTVSEPSPDWLINALNDDDLPCARLPPPLVGRQQGYSYPPSTSSRHQPLQSKYLPFQHQPANPPSPNLYSELDIAESCVDSAISSGALCISDQAPKLDVVWTFANGSGVLHEKWRKVREVQQRIQRAGTLAPRAALLPGSRRPVAGTEKKLFRYVGYFCRGHVWSAHFHIDSNKTGITMSSGILCGLCCSTFVLIRRSFTSLPAISRSHHAIRTSMRGGGSVRFLSGLIFTDPLGGRMVTCS
jgi:hypothetical protein